VSAGRPLNCPSRRWRTGRAHGARHHTLLTCRFRYVGVLITICACLKTHIEASPSRFNRGTLIIPVMLGMLVGWSLGRAFLAIRLDLEAALFGCDKLVPRYSSTSADSLLSSHSHHLRHLVGGPPDVDEVPDVYNATVSPFAAAAGAIAAGSGAGGEDDIMCEELRPSEYTIRFRLAYAFIATLFSSLLILLLEPAAALATLGSSPWRRKLGRRVRSLVQLLSTALSITSMMMCARQDRGGRQAKTAAWHVASAFYWGHGPNILCSPPSHHVSRALSPVAEFLTMSCACRQLERRACLWGGEGGHGLTGRCEDTPLVLLLRSDDVWRLGSRHVFP